MSRRASPTHESGWKTTESGACTWPTTCSRGTGRWCLSTLCQAAERRARVHVFEADHETLSSATGLDAHAMDPAAVFASLNALGGTPPYTVVVGCEVESVEEGIGLSDPVAAAIPDAVRSVEDVVARLLTPVRGG